VAHGEAAHVRLVDDRLVPRPWLRPAAPRKAGSTT
jgi:hypothetical protein